MTGKYSTGTGLILFLILLQWACSKKDDSGPVKPDFDKNRKAILTNLADQIIIPSYQGFKTKLDAMATKSQAFAAQPSPATLIDFRSAWSTGYQEWQKVELFDFGPGATRTIRNYYNIYPTSVQGINTYINNPAENLEVSASLDKQGFPALDYLLNGTGATDAEIIAWYTAPVEGPKRLAYVQRVVLHMQTILNQVIGDWNGEYYTRFTTRTGTDIGSPMGEMVNGYILHYERYIRSGKFGIPSGAMLDGIVAANKVEAFYSKSISKVLAQTAHQAAVDFFNGKSVKSGTDGPSLKTYLDAIEAKDKVSGKLLSELINDQFAASKVKMDALGANLYQEVLTNNQAVKSVYAELQKAVRMLKVDMTSAMSITITYTDNDGD